MEEGLTFKILALDPDHAPFGIFCHAGDGTCQGLSCTEFEVSSFTRSKDTAHVPLNGWMREGVRPNSRVDLRRFLPDPHEIWHKYSLMVNA